MPNRAPLASSETRFVETSRSGLSIVPASCLSDPHNPCTFNGQTIADCSAVTAYQSPTVPYGQSCISETRTCSDGSLSGSYQYSSCIVADPPAPTCSVSVDTSSVNQPNGTYLRWTSTSVVTSFYISNVGNVGGSGAAWVAPSQTTAYSGSASGPGGSGSCGTTLTVNRSCTFDGQTVTHGSSVTAWLTAAVPYGSSCVSQTRTCSDGALSGSYQYSSCSALQPASCTLDGVTVAHGQSRTFYSVRTAPSGALCSSYAQTRTCTNGSLSGSSSYQYASCSCTPRTVYTCSPQNVIRTVTNASCTVTVTNPYDTCVSPEFCSAGSEVCLDPTPSFNQSGGYTGHLQARPKLVPVGDATTLFWNVGNVSSCDVAGGGRTWPNMTTSGQSGAPTDAINGNTDFTLTCTKIDLTTFSEVETVNVAPTFQEL